MILGIRPNDAPIIGPLSPVEGLSMSICRSTSFDRTTGAVRDVECYVRLSLEEMDWISRAQAHNPPLAVAVAVLVNRFTRKALAIGPFETASDAWGWWFALPNVVARDGSATCTVLTPTTLPHPTGGAS